MTVETCRDFKKALQVGQDLGPGSFEYWAFLRRTFIWPGHSSFELGTHSSSKEIVS